MYLQESLYGVCTLIDLRTAMRKQAKTTISLLWTSLSTLWTQPIKVAWLGL